MNDAVTVVAAVAAAGVVAQAVAARTKLPAIVLLLAFGLVLGPVLGLVEPDDVYGDLLFPAASAAVAILLFDGGLSLRFRELRDERLVLVRLLTIGVVVTWVVGAGAAVITGLPLGVAAIFGAIMTVTGPTVVVPLLREARLRPRVTRILKWEGILIDPIGAVLAVVTFEIVVEGHGGAADAVQAVAATVGAGVVVGLVVSVVVVLALARRLVRDRLEIPAILAGILVAVAVANSIFDEAGLVAATAMGVALGNQRWVETRRIVAFHESLGVILVGIVFVLLAARVEAATLATEAVPATILLLVLVLVARPLSVWASTIGSRLTTNERGYLAAMAPRGVVAASVSALFALRLEELGVSGGANLAALTFIVVAGTVLIYGAAARPLALRLRVAAPEPTGVVLVGAEPWLLQVGAALSAAEVPVLVVSGDAGEREAAARCGLLTHTGPLQPDAVQESLEAVGARLAVTGSHREELNGLAHELLADHVGRANIYVVSGTAPTGDANRRAAFGGRLTAEQAAARVANGEAFAVRPASSAGEGDEAIPLFHVSPAGVPTMVERRLKPPTTGQLIVLARRQS